MELEQIFNQEKKGTFIKDEKKNEAFVFHGKILSKIQPKSIEDTKKLDVNSNISSLAKSGEEICSLLENDKLFFFEGSALEWIREGKEIGIVNSLHRWALGLFLFLSFGLIISLSLLIGIWAALIAIFFISLSILSFFLKFVPTTNWNVYLRDMDGNGDHDIILHRPAGTRFIFLDHSGSIQRELDIRGDGYTKGTIIKFWKGRNEGQKIWIRAKGKEGEDTLILTLNGINKKLRGISPLEILDWNNDGQPEIASVSGRKFTIYSRKGEILLEKEISVPIAAYAGDLQGDETQSLVLLGREKGAFFLSILKGEELSTFKLDFFPLFLDLVGLADINSDECDEIILKSFWEDAIRFLVFTLK